MEQGMIEREIFVDASPDVVFDVVSRPEHVREWWPDDARYDATAGSTGAIVFGRDSDATVVALTVIDARPPHRFAFRWTHPAGRPAEAANSLLVTFELTASRGGTLLKMTESGFRELGWEAAVLEQQYREHAAGWDFYLPRLATYVAGLGARP